MSSDKDQVMSFTRRALVMGGVKGALVLTLAARLGYLQLVESSKFKTLADKNRINLKLLAPVRGIIYDRNGQGLAINEQDFRVQVTPEQTEDLEGSLETLSRILPLRPQEIESVLTRANQQAKFLPIEIIDNLSWEQVAAIEVNMPDLAGISIDEGKRRFYPQGPATAHLVGYVGSVAKHDRGQDPVLGLPGFRVGKTGLEKEYETELRGEAGNSRIEVNVAGRMIRELERENGKTGENIALTVDLDLQKKVQEFLGREKSASAVVMDAHTGAVYALASSPSFDPNLFSTGISQDAWNLLNTDDTHPLNNKAVGGVYPPGSTFKMITAMAGLEANVIKEDTQIYCPGYYEIGDHRFHCWKKGGHGTVDLTQALCQSCDTFFYSLSRDIGIDRIAAMANRLGLGDTLGIELPEERKGTVPSQAWKLKALGKKWEGGETVVASIGQGYLQATPLQLATMTARLVNGGKAVKPWVVAKIGQKDVGHARGNWPELGLIPEHIMRVRMGMEAVVNDERGTAHPYAVNDPAQAFGGKTGTAQVRRITEQQREEGMVPQEDQPWKFRHQGLFVGYAPKDNPRYVTCVVVEHAGGSGPAVSIAKDILLAVQAMQVGNTPVRHAPARDVPSKEDKARGTL